MSIHPEPPPMTTVASVHHARSVLPLCGSFTVARRWGRREVHKGREMGSGRWSMRREMGIMRIRERSLRTAAEGMGGDGVQEGVLLFGATGNVGKRVLKQVLRLYMSPDGVQECDGQLLESGRRVVAAVRSGEKLKEVMMELGMEADGRLVVMDGVDLMKAETLTEEVFDGVRQVMMCVGPSADLTNLFGACDQTVFGVDSLGVANVVAAAERFMAPDGERKLVKGCTLTSEMEWTLVSDAEHVGSSVVEVSSRGDKEPGFCMKGSLVLIEYAPGAVGAYAGLWAPPVNSDVTEADGVQFSVKGDGRTYFLMLQTEDPETDDKNFFVAPFDTVIHLFICEPDTSLHGRLGDGSIDRSVSSFPRIPENEPRRDRSSGCTETDNPQTHRLRKPLLSMPSVDCEDEQLSTTTDVNRHPLRQNGGGDFAFEVGSISCYRAPRSQVVLLSSGAVERSARLGSDIEQRNADIPTLRLNPGGALNHKYEGEITVRRSSLLYSIVRPTGFIPEVLEAEDTEPYLLQATQGDTAMGRTRFQDAADVLIRCLDYPEAVGKTFELRRSPGPEAKGKAMTDADYLRLFLSIVDDQDRAKVGLQPFAKPIDPEMPILYGGRKAEDVKPEFVESVSTQLNTMYKDRNDQLNPLN